MSDMDIEISTKKINMTLDEIIKQNKRTDIKKGPRAALKKRNQAGMRKKPGNNTNNNTTQNNTNTSNKNNNTSTKKVNTSIKIKKTGQGQSTPKKEIQKKMQAISPDKIKIHISNNKVAANNNNNNNSIQKPKQIAFKRPIKRISAAIISNNKPIVQVGAGRIVRIQQEKKVQNQHHNNNNNGTSKTLNDRFSRK